MTSISYESELGIEDMRIIFDQPQRRDSGRVRGYNFPERLSARAAELRRGMELFGAVIWPVIVRAEDSQLMDGNCRYRTLADMGISRSYVYLGSIR